jgi:YggT family protein
MITIFFNLLETLLNYYSYAVVISAVMSILMSFGVLDSRNSFVWKLSEILYRLTEPALRPIRAVLPTMGGIDFSPWILLIIIRFTIELLARVNFAIVAHSAQPLLF